MARTKNYPGGAKYVKGILYDDIRKCYYVTLYFGTNSEGKATTKTKTAPTLEKAKEIQKQHKTARLQGDVIPVEKDTLVERASNFIEYKSLSLESTTIYGYKNLLNNHIAPYFKSKRIQDISVQDLKAYISHLSKKKKLSNTSIRKHTDFLNQIFKEAYRERIIKENPFDFMDLVKTDTKEKACFSASEIVELLESVSDTQLETPVYLAVYLGLRREEVLGLKWENIDFENKLIHITSVVTQAGSSLVKKAPKTDKSERTLKYPDVLHDVLLRQKNKKPTKKHMGETIPRSEYVVTMDSGKPFRPNYLSACFSAHIKKNHFKDVSFHGLRHTYASIAYNAGAPLQEISDSLGHSTPSTTTRVYTHEFVREKAVAPGIVAESIEQAKTTTNPSKKGSP